MGNIILMCLLLAARKMACNCSFKISGWVLKRRTPRTPKKGFPSKGICIYGSALSPPTSRVRTVIFEKREKMFS